MKERELNHAILQHVEERRHACDGRVSLDHEREQKMQSRISKITNSQILSSF